MYTLSVYPRGIKERLSFPYLFTNSCNHISTNGRAPLHSFINLQHNGPFAVEQSRGTKSPHWRANDALGHVKESHQIWIFFVQHVPVRHLLSSMAILYHVIAQLQKTHSSIKGELKAIKLEFFIYTLDHAQ